MPHLNRRLQLNRHIQVLLLNTFANLANADRTQSLMGKYSAVDLHDGLKRVGMGKGATEG